MKIAGTIILIAALAAISAFSACKSAEASAAGTISEENSDQTVELDVADLETYDLGENFGEFKDESYWEQRLGGHDDDALPTSNKIFIVSVDADTTDAMMQEVIDKYSLEVIYDYENFSMYALAVPEPLDEEQTQAFIKELENNYDFILMVEPDSVMYLDSAAE